MPKVNPQPKKELPKKTPPKAAPAVIKTPTKAKAPASGTKPSGSVTKATASGTKTPKAPVVKKVAIPNAPKVVRTSPAPVIKVPTTPPSATMPLPTGHLPKATSSVPDPRTSVPDVRIFTDGSFKGGTAAGGYAALMTCGASSCVVRGNERNTTNNRMELQSVLSATQMLTQPCNVTIISDSQYVVNSINQWIDGWKRRSWTTATGKPVENVDLMRSLDEQRQQHKIHAQWVRGHNGHPENEFVDQQAQRMADQLKR